MNNSKYSDRKHYSLNKSFLFYTAVIAVVYILSKLILDYYNLAYLDIVKNIIGALISIGFLSGIIQLVLHFNNRASKIISVLLTVLGVIFLFIYMFFAMMFYDREEFVTINGNKMVQVTHSFLLSNWINYYDYVNPFVRGKHVRIHEAHNNCIGEYLYTIYYDEHGNMTGTKDLSVN